MNLIEAKVLLGDCLRYQCYTYSDTFTTWMKGDTLIARGHNSHTVIVNEITYSDYFEKTITKEFTFIGDDAKQLTECGVGMGSNLRSYRDGKWVEYNLLEVPPL